MSEPYRGDDLLDLRVGGILVELLILDRRAEVRRPKGIRIVLEQNVRREKLSIKLYRVVLANRPIVPGYENKLRVARPPPYAFRRRRDRHPGSYVLSDCAELGGRARALYVDRIGDC